MANFRQIHVKIWKDAWFLDLDPAEKLLFMYLFSNEQANLCGIYEISTRVIAFETGLAYDFILSTLAKFADANKVFYEDGIIFVVNMLRYNMGTKGVLGDTARTNVIKNLAELPECHLRRLFYEHYSDLIPNPYPIYTLSPVNVNVNDSVSVNENDGENSPSAATAAAAEAVNAFNDPLPLRAERLYQRVTGQASIPASSRAQAEHDLIAVLDYYGGHDPPIEDGKRIFARWCSTTGKSGKPYSRLNPGWIAWWLEELAPVPVSVQTKDVKDMTSEEFHKYVLAQGGSHA